MFRAVHGSVLFKRLTVVKMHICIICVVGFITILKVRIKFLLDKLTLYLQLLFAGIVTILLL